MTEDTPRTDPVPPRTPGPVGRALATFRRWPRPARVTTFLALGLVLALVAGLLGGVVLTRRPLPQTSGTVAVPGLGAAVEVVRDERGVPQVYADTTEDLVRAQGYVTASERFFQMDVRRHVAAGRLAELFGERAVGSDTLARTLGWERTARAELALIEPGTRAALAAYADGVNAYVAQHDPSDLAVEYTLLDLGGLTYQPEPWSEVDSLAWLKTVAWELGGNLDEEVDRALTAAAVGSRGVADLFPPTEDVAAPVVGQGAVVDGVYEQDAERGGTRNPRRPGWFADQPPAARRAATQLVRATGAGLDAQPAWVGRGSARGSNAWVVDGEHTVSGEPLLANDPHLDVGVPGVWMQVGLHCRTLSAACPYDVAGSSLPGVPGVVIGHNTDVAWGMANLEADVTDLFVERVDGDSYRFAGRSVPLRTRRETIEVADADDVTIEVRSTRHGPLLSEAFLPYAELATSTSLDDRVVTGRDGRPITYGLSVQWEGLRPGTTADAILALDRAAGWDDFREALSSFALPAQGVVYADTAGHVGFQAAGRVPVRKSGNDGSLPAAGWRSETDWTADPVPYDGLPSVLDPEAGTVVAANQAAAGPDYAYSLTTSPDPGYRAARVAALLGDREDLDVADMVALQADRLDPMAPVLTPYLLAVSLPAGYASDGQRLLAGWDHVLDADSGAAAYYEAVWNDLLALTFRDELPPGLWPDGGARWVAVVQRLLDEPGSPWWDDRETESVVETRDDVLAEAMRDARDDLTRLQAVDPAEWEWGRSHTLDLVSDPYGLLGSAVTRRLLNRTGTPTGGSSSTVDATAWDAAEPVDTWAVTTAPSMRMVVDLGDLDASRWISIPGVSGHPSSSHYDDQLDAWTTGEAPTWPFTPDAVTAAGTDTLVLEPTG